VNDAHDNAADDKVMLERHTRLEAVRAVRHELNQAEDAMSSGDWDEAYAAAMRSHTATAKLQEMLRPETAQHLALLASQCGYTIWPYTENNRCVREKHIGLHRDARGRQFNNAGYIRIQDV